MTDIHGILGLNSVFQAEKEILPGLMTGRNLYSHWAVMPSDTAPEKGREGYVNLQSGDLLTIFTSAAEGPVLWEGTIALENERNAPHTGKKEKSYDYGVHGLQKDMPIKDWGRMFSQSRPVILTRKGKTIHGNLHPFSETGTEGVIWSVQEWNKYGYDGLHCLENGDQIKVLHHVTNGEKVFEGALTLMPKFIEVAYHEHYKEKFQLRPLEITPKDLMTYCVWNLPVIVSRPS